MSNPFDFTLRFLPDLLSGMGMTLLLTMEGLLAGFVLGLAAALARTYTRSIWRWLAIGYVELFRGTPLLMQLFLVYYGLPGLGITLSRELAAFLALGLNSGAYQAEYLRGSILAIGEGQMMAGRAIGMSKWSVVFNIILPQALRLAIPSWANEPVSLLKSTSVVFLIAVPELMARAKSIAAKTYEPLRAYFAVALVYLFLVFIVDTAMKWLEKRTSQPGLETESKSH